jgi:pyruvate/2-oxoglutarate dehydrogenase complex dihydrolipoamide dehydrogenase (E3) component
VGWSIEALAVVRRRLQRTGVRPKGNSGAHRQGVAARVAKLPMKAVRRTATMDETQIFMKVLVGASDDRILGFTMIGAEAGEVMIAVQAALAIGLHGMRITGVDQRAGCHTGK